MNLPGPAACSCPAKQHAVCVCVQHNAESHKCSKGDTRGRQRGGPHICQRTVWPARRQSAPPPPPVLSHAASRWCCSLQQVQQTLWVGHTGLDHVAAESRLSIVFRKACPHRLDGALSSPRARKLPKARWEHLDMDTSQIGVPLFWDPSRSPPKPSQKENTTKA